MMCVVNRLHLAYIRLDYNPGEKKKAPPPPSTFFHKYNE